MTFLRILGWTTLLAAAAAAAAVWRPDWADRAGPEAGAYARLARERVPKPVSTWLGFDAVSYTHLTLPTNREV